MEKKRKRLPDSDPEAYNSERRIAYVMDEGARKGGRIGILVACGIVLMTSTVVSCGYRPEAATAGMEAEDLEETTAGAEAEGLEPSQAAFGDTEPETGFDYNHAYNGMLRVYGEDVYLAREDGIYKVSGGAGGEALVYANDYALSRGAELYRNYLYFCGTTQRGDMEAATLYRMDLDTLEVTDALAAFGNVFTGLHQISIYEDKLYVATDYAGHRIGFQLRPDGTVGSRLDETAADFLYRENNTYADLTLRMVMEADMERIARLKDAQNGMYQAVLDVASCRRLLHGRLLVSRCNPNDDLSRCLYLENGDGGYEYLCDIREWPLLAVEDGVYYVAMDGGIRYLDFADRQERRLWEQTREWSQISLLTYDASYLYFVKSRPVGFDARDVAVSEEYLMRVPRQGGEAERVYRFEGDAGFALSEGLCGNCGVYGDTMYIQGQPSIVLDPVRNGMQGLNAGERSADSLALEETAETFALAYFQNDAKTCRLLLTDDYAERVELYAQPEHADDIERLYLGGLPEGEVEEGVSVWLSYEFREYGEEVRTYLSMELVKTPQGWRVAFYGLER
ncbi:MAG: hypothetical protein NC337_11890 [Roseburia sp.]|nr:hypothetical protein [Roseburia sp.]